MSKALETLVHNLKLEQLETNLFRGVSLDQTRFRVYGGQVLGQAMAAASQTVESSCQVHSFASYFLRPGDTSIPIVYDVDRVRDGRSIVTRHVTAIQKGRPIFEAIISFHIEETGFEHQADMPNVPGPDSLPSEEERHLRYFEETNQTPEYNYQWPIEFRHVDPINFNQPEKKAATAYVWFKADGELPDETALHQAVLAYASDSPILVTACRPHPEINADNALLATINHSMWYHQPFRADQWLLYALESTSASNGRGFVRGSIFNQAGVLIASATQEGILRTREKTHQMDIIGDPTGFRG